MFSGSHSQIGWIKFKTKHFQVIRSDSRQQHASMAVAKAFRSVTIGAFVQSQTPHLCHGSFHSAPQDILVVVSCATVTTPRSHKPQLAHSH